MLKSFHWTAMLSAASILFIAETAFSLPLTVSSKYPVVSTSDTDKLVCYMQTADGMTLNLNKLCKNKLSIQSQIVVSNVIYEDDHLIGSVINKSSKTLYQARVNYEVVGENGSVIEAGAIATNPPTLSPGQTATFQTFMLGGRHVRITFAEGNQKE